jgi:tetratricopeptide (TPR) repeat protein
MSKKRARDQHRKPSRRKLPSKLINAVSNAFDAERSSSSSGSGRSRAGLRLIVTAAILAGIGLGLTAKIHGRNGEPSGSKYSPRAKGTLTYCKDVAPIVFRNCSGCHRPEEAAPFSLLTFDQVRKHARQIAEVTAKRYMPPWPPEPGYGDFVEERRLTPDELGVIRQWVAEGAAEGSASELPPIPETKAGWKMGEPDLVIIAPEAYNLASEGKDVYRNLVFPIPVNLRRFVRAVEFRPGNPKVVHHAFIDVDETRQSRRLAEKQSPAGFDGMELPDTAVMPAGQFLGWQPGKSLYVIPDGLAWVLKTNTDLVLQMHLHPSGKPEKVQPSVGFYFTDQAPTNLPFRLRLLYYELDIPPGAEAYTVEQSYVLPVAVSLLRVNPHAHYLGKDLQGYAELPDGGRKWLLRIKDWDFNWQGDYQYARPVELPRGTKICMRFSYDNSTNNLRNPNRPPQRVRHGVNSSDEMAALGFQALAHSAEDRDLLSRDYQKYLAQVLISFFRFRLRQDAGDATAHTRLASFLYFQGKNAEALEHATQAVKLKPDYDQAHYQLGSLYLAGNRLTEANEEFRTVIRLNPQDYQAYGNLGLISLKQRQWMEARRYLEVAVQLNPDDQIARRNLNLVEAALEVR